MQFWTYCYRFLCFKVKTFTFFPLLKKSITHLYYLFNRTSCTDLPRGACVTVEISIEHPGAPLLLSGVRGVVLASRYLIEPISNGKSRVMHLSRVDTKYV